MDTVNRAPIGTSGDMPLPMNFETLFAGDQSDGNDFDWSEFFPGAGIDLPGDLPVPAAPTEESDTGLEPSDQAESAGGGTHASSGSDSGSDSEADSETSGAEPESPAGSVGSAPYAGVQPDRGAFHNAQGMGYQQSTVERTQSHYQSTSTIEQPPYQPTNNIRQPSYQPTNIHPQSQSVPHGSYSTQAGSGLTNGIISSYGDAQPNYGFYNAPGFDAPVSQAPAPSQTAYGFSGGDRSGQPSVQQLYGHFSTPDLFPPPMSAPGLYTRSNAATWNGPPVTGGSASSSSGNSYMQQLGPPPAPWQAASSGFAPVRRDSETDVPTDQGFGTASSALTGPGTVRQSTQTSYMMFGDQLPNFKLVPGYEQYGLMVNASDFFPSLYPAMLDGEMYTKHKLAGHCDRLNRRLIAIKSLEVETGPQSGRNEHSQRLQNKAAAEFKYEYTSGVTLVPYSQGKPGSGDDASLTSAHWSECIRLLYKPLIAAQRWVDENHPDHNDPLRVPLIEVAHALILVRSLLARPVDYQSFHYFLHLLVNMGLPEYQKARDTVTTYCQGDPYVFRDLYLHNQWGPRVPQMEAIKSEHH